MANGTTPQSFSTTDYMLQRTLASGLNLPQSAVSFCSVIGEQHITTDEGWPYKELLD
jgi:hypothetical protein